MRPGNRTRTTLATLASVALTGGLLTFATAPATAADGTRVAKPDFNGDGKGDTAFGGFRTHVGGNAEAGQIVVLYGSSTGVAATRRTVIAQNTAGVPGTPEPGDTFGDDLAHGDFDDDGYDDLAVSAPKEDVGDRADAGSVTVLWGSAAGLSGQSAVNVDDPVGGNGWGSSLAAGDFDGDGRDDLLVLDRDQSLQVFEGITKAGTHSTRHALRTPADYYPSDLTAGDVNGDGATDLVTSGTQLGENDGLTNRLYTGGPDGLSSLPVQKLRPGHVSAIGDIDRDGFGDVVSGAYHATTGSDGTPWPYTATGGQVWIGYGSATGVGRIAAVSEDTAGVPGASEESDCFGWDVDLGDVNKDGYLDLAVGTIQETVGDAYRAGSVVVLYGSAKGITGTGAQAIHQDTAGVPGANEDHDQFGRDVKLDDVTGDGRADLLVGTFENANGSVVQLPSSGSKITGTGSRSISPTSVGVSTAGNPQFGETFAD
ncbi:FG-GAP repeat protein [Streptomyces sp. NPDC002644]